MRMILWAERPRAPSRGTPESPHSRCTQPAASTDRLYTFSGNGPGTQPRESRPARAAIGAPSRGASKTAPPHGWMCRSTW
eukprot:8869622-Pyramimonas_sp.AAC.1